MIKKRLTALLMLIVMLLPICGQAVDISAEGGCTINFETGEFIYEKNADTPMAPASMTKIMTLYIIFEKIADGSITKDTLIPISENAAQLSRTSAYTNIPLTAGESLSVETLIKAIVTVSACASCTAIGEYFCGSEDAFSKLMNEKAAEIGLSAYFADASGISNYNAITPRSMAYLTYVFIKNYPDILNYTSLQSAWINGKKYTSTNLLLSPGSKHYYSGADGFKTGTTNKAGKCLVSTAEKDGKRIINVVMKSPTNDSRYTDTIKLFNNAYSQPEYNPNYLYSTDIKAYINGFEIPCCYYMGKNNTLCVVAENLNSFGFDVHYDSSASTLYIYDNPAKEIDTMIPGDIEPMTPMYQILSDRHINVVLVKQDGQQHTLKNVYVLNGMCAVSLDELGTYFSYTWNGDTLSAMLVA